MARRSTLAGVIIMMAVSSCGGGGGDSPSPSPTPTPSPTASSTPTPTAAAFPLSAAREFGTVSTSMSFTGDLAGPITLNAPALDAFANRLRLALQPTTSSTATTETVVREDTEEARYVGTNLTTAPATGVTTYGYAKSDATTGAFSQLSLLNNSVSGSVTSDTALALTYVSYLGWYRGDTTAGAKRASFAAFGNPATTAEIPTTGTVNYTMRIASRYVIARSAAAGTTGDLTGTVTTSINYATGTVTITAQLLRGGVAYANLSGSGSITAASNRITGSLVNTTGTGTATFQGVAYGPQAAELGITFALSGVTADGGTSNAVGVLVGKRS